MKNKTKVIIIYLPNGKDCMYSTKKMTRAKLAKKIECSPGRVLITLPDDGESDSQEYVGMPYYVEIF